MLRLRGFLYAPLDSRCESLSPAWNYTFADTKNSEVQNIRCSEVLQYVMLQQDIKMDEERKEEKKKEK